MDLSSVQTQQAYKCEGVREVKGSISESEMAKIKKDGLKEVFFEADNKKYVAYGQDMDVTKIKNDIHGKFKGSEITINFSDDETNTAWGGAKSAVKSTAGAVTESVAGVLGGGLAWFVSEFHGIGGGGSYSSAKIAGNTLGAAAVVALAATVVVGSVGAIRGGTKGTDYETLKSISTEIK